MGEGIVTTHVCLSQNPNGTCAAAESNGMKFLDPSAPSTTTQVSMVRIWPSQHLFGALATMGAIVGALRLSRDEVHVLPWQWTPQGNNQLAFRSGLSGSGFERTRGTSVG